MQDFTSVKGLNTNDVLKEVDFPITRYPLVTDPDNQSTRYDLIERTDTKARLGLVNKKKTIIPYRDAMEWLLDEFNDSNVDFKLRDSVVMNKGDVYQEYIFDHNVDSPDGVDIGALVIARFSYIASLIELNFGTYRYACSNGVLTGETISTVKVKGNTQDILKSSIVNDIKNAFAKFKNVSKLYQKLETSEVFTDYLKSYITNVYITAGYKKAVLNELVDGGNIEIMKDGKIKHEDLEDPSTLYNVKQEISAWAFYNILTNIASSRARSVGSRTNNYFTISKIFDI